jgi:hypothetical protein
MSITCGSKRGNNNLKVSFTDKQISSNVTFTYIQDFKDALHFRGLLDKHLGKYEPLKAKNSKFRVADAVEFMSDAVILGYSRFLHMEQLRTDTAYKAIRRTNLPSEKVCRDTLALLPAEAADSLKALNKELLEKKANADGPREIAADFDDTVITVFGNQERSNIGYNPKYHGRPSYKEKVGVVSSTKELVNLSLEEGSHHSNFNFLEFFKEFEQSLPKTWYLKRVRCDRGFCDDDNFTYFEDQGYEYVVKAKMTANMKKVINYVVEHPEDYHWIQADERSEDHAVFHTTDIRLPMPKWARSRRIVIVRKTLPDKTEEGQLVFDICRYEYQAIITNIDYLTTSEIFSEYNQRCIVETSIDEIKSGFAFSENSQIDYKCNELYMLIKMIAYNLQNWFRSSVLPEEERHHRISTLRRIFYKTCGVIVGHGWYRHVIYQANESFQKIVDHVQKALITFRIQMEGS